MKVLIINGPNLNLLGTREPGIYGAETLADVGKGLDALASSLDLHLVHFQSNSEGEIVDRIHQARGEAGYVVINAGAYTHTSVAIRDAPSGVDIPFIEVHVSNVHAREPFRHHSFLSDKAVGVIAGLGTFGYEAALRFIHRRLETRKSGTSKP